MKLTEKQIQNQILSYLRALGIYCWKHWQGPMSPVKGIADIIGVTKDGRFIAIEVKGENGKASIEQQHFLHIINSCNGIALLVRSVNEVMEKIKVGLHGVKTLSRDKLKQSRTINVLEMTYELEDKIVVEFWTQNDIFIGRLIQEKINLTTNQKEKP